MNLLKLYHNINEGFDFQSIADEFNNKQDELENNNGLDTDIEYNNIDIIIDNFEEKFDVILNFLKKHLIYKSSGKLETSEFIFNRGILVVEFEIKLKHYGKVFITINKYRNAIYFTFKKLKFENFKLFYKSLNLIIKNFNKDEVILDYACDDTLYNIWLTINKKELSFNKLNKILDEIFKLLNKIDLL